jgi:hypothetical protein
VRSQLKVPHGSDSGEKRWVQCHDERPDELRAEGNLEFVEDASGDNGVHHETRHNPETLELETTPEMVCKRTKNESNKLILPMLKQSEAPSDTEIWRRSHRKLDHGGPPKILK